LGGKAAAEIALQHLEDVLLPVAIQGRHLDIDSAGGLPAAGNSETVWEAMALRKELQYLVLRS
jgi:hypothetical protein